MTFWKKQNDSDSKRISGCQRLGESGTSRQSTEGHSDTTLHNHSLHKTAHMIYMQICYIALQDAIIGREPKGTLTLQMEKLKMKFIPRHKALAKIQPV